MRLKFANFKLYVKALFKYENPIHFAISLLFNEKLTLNQLFFLTMIKELDNFDFVDDGYRINLEHCEVRYLIEKGLRLKKAPKKRGIWRYKRG